ncbi:MAG: type II toxin-antitoxin system RelE family toxin [Candidatus Methylomirabilales bacterium]
MKPASAPLLKRYGSPLRGTLKGYWKLRIGDYRVVGKIVGSEVWIFGVLHRKRIYEDVLQRIGRRPR